MLTGNLAIMFIFNAASIGSRTPSGAWLRVLDEVPACTTKTTLATLRKRPAIVLLLPNASGEGVACCAYFGGQRAVLVEGW